MSKILGPVASLDRADKSKIKQMTPGQRWKLRRNLVIYVAAQHGASQRLLADVFDLPHSRINAILKEYRSRYADGAPPAED